MPPARKKRGAAAAAAAAASAAQWKVGDLVLAKMKGFPPWPAMISEPHQWDLSPVRKKLLVYFYGTKEIAFCNYADLEAFTEEKKKSLLAKRHGKGADFVRAVKEIIEIYDSLKTENNNKRGLTQNKVGLAVENLVNNSSSLDTGGPEYGSDLVNENKMVDCPAPSMDHSMISTPGPNIITVEGERCVMNAAHGEPIEKLPVLDELRHSPLHVSSCSKKWQKDSQQQNSCTHGNFTSSQRSKSSSGSELRTRQGSSRLMNSTNLPSVRLVPGDKQEDVSLHKSIDDDKSNSRSPLATKEVVLLPSSQGTCGQLGGSGTSNDDNKVGIATKNVQSTCSIDVPQTGGRDKEVKLNETHDLPMSTTLTFKRKRRPNTRRANNPVISGVTNMDSELLPKSSENLVDSPNSSNEINKSDGDEHLPLVKRARVRMERPILDNATVNEPDVSYNKIELVNHADQCYESGMPEQFGEDHSANVVPPGIDPSPKIDMSLPSGEVQTACKDKEYQPKVLTLDVESALPPSKRLHRALEAMSANVSETISNLHEVTKSKDIILESCTVAGPPSNNPAGTLVKSPKSAIATSPKLSLSAHSLDASTGQKVNPASALVKSPKSAIATSPKISLSAHSLDAPTGQKHTSGPIMLNKDVISTVPPDLKNDVSDSPPKDKISEETHMDDGDTPDVFVCSRIHNDICGKAATYSVKLKEPASVSFDLPPSPKASVKEPAESIGGPTNGFGKNIDGCAEPVSQANAVVSDTSGSCNPEPHDETVLAEPMVNACDRTSASSLVSKVPCIHSDASTRTCEALSSSVIAPKELNHSLSLTDKSLSPDSTPMEELVADGHAHRFSRSNSFMEDSKVISESLVNIPSLKEGSSGRYSPSNRTMRSASDRVHTEQNSGQIPFDNLQPKSLNKLAGRSEANSARRAFEAFVGTLTRTKESISRATRLALDCAKHGIAGEVMDIIIEHLEKETNLYKRVDLFFLVDSIIRYCRNQKGAPGDVYPSLIQAVLPRIIYASAPPGNSAWENRRQCLKVLRLWLERKTLSEYIIRHHIKELEVLNEASFGSSHRPSGTERALNDPLRDDEEFLVDEYGSNAGFHLPSFISTKVLEDEEGRSSEERSFEAVTPGHEITSASELDTSELHAAKHQLILEEVDGELEMEDAAPSSGAEASCMGHQDVSNISGAGTAQHLNSVPPLPDDKPPSPPPLPSSPPPLPRPPCSASQGSHVQGALLVAADRVEQHHPGATYNVEGQHPYSGANNRGNMDACANQYSSQPPVSYNSGYAGHTNQILPPPPPQPVAPFHPSEPHGNICGPSVPHHGNNYHQPPSAPLPNNAYHLQPPPHPPAPNQFLYPPEPEQRTQPWNYNPPDPQRYQYGGHDRGHHEYDRRHHFDDREHHFNVGGHCFDDGGYHFDDRWHQFHDKGPHFSDRAVRGQMHHEIIDGGRFPPYFPSGLPFPDHFEAPPTQLHCGRPSDPPRGPCSGWSMPHRRSKYPPASRHSEPQVSHGGGWRRHG